MPEHVHLLMSEPKQGTPSAVLQKLKLGVSRRMRRRGRPGCAGQLRLPSEEEGEPLRAFWQARFYDFNVYTNGKRTEKLNYAPESGDSRTGETSERLAVEQLVVLREGRTWGTLRVVLGRERKEVCSFDRQERPRK